MKSFVKYTALLILLSAAASPWKTLYNSNGLSVSFLFYGKADNHNNGVVLKIRNSGSSALVYKFKLIFKTLSAAKSTVVKGFIEAGETKAGENDGLFWIPFPGKNEMSEVGITDIFVKRLNSGEQKVPD